jgi:hypothetical protein
MKSSTYDDSSGMPATPEKALCGNVSAKEWVSVADRLPPSGQKVLAFYMNDAGRERRICAEWVAEKSVEASPESEIGEYDEDDDCYYDPAGWYEQIDNWPDYTAVAVHHQVTHWMPLPEPPNTN